MCKTYKSNQKFNQRKNDLTACKNSLQFLNFAHQEKIESKYEIQNLFSSMCSCSWSFPFRI